MLNVGLIGLGSAWEWRYRPALARLSHRLRIRGVYDPVSNRAQQIAVQHQAQASLGVRSLIERRDIQALLILDPGWHGRVPLIAALEGRKPVYYSGSFGDDLAAVQALHQQVGEIGLDVMPEFSRRYTPSTGRARELIATCAGTVQEIVLRVPFPMVLDRNPVPGQILPRDVLIGLVDWCRSLVGMPLGTLEQLPLLDAADRSYQLHFQPAGHPGKSIPATIILAAPEQGIREWEAHLQCERAHLTLLGDATIAWEMEGKTHIESLAAERPDVDVMLDLFTRRVVGGLMPVPTLHDVCVALQCVPVECCE